ncbi:MAG TPA: D-aminoacylase [Vicinamibacterales bacterium]|nr:D-aminoacylase [Vicinamibacterales bacterium]
MRRAGRRIALSLGAMVLAGWASAAQQPDFDLLIVNATIVDGTGAPARPGTIAIKDGRIVRVAPSVAGAARERLDAIGLTVAPGFIDVHTHADDLADHPAAANFVAMGVTTIVAGNCGSSALEIGDALERIRQARAAVNFATLIGHNTVRSAVMGASQREAAVDEIAKMRALVFRGMVEGAIGFSTGLQYVPGTYAKNNEIVELARAAANEHGLYATHMRNEGTALLDAVRESIRVAEMLDMRLEISHLKVDSPKQWGTSAAALALIDDARRRGLKVQADQYAYTAGSSALSIRFPSWALEGGQARISERLNDPATWQRIKTEIKSLVEERGFTDLSWATVASYRADPTLNGLSMKTVAEKLRGEASADAQFEAARTLMLGGGASMVYHFMSDDDVARIMKHPFVAVASDAGLIEPGAGVPHPRGYGNTVRVLGSFVRDQHVISLTEAIRKMTALPAEHMGFTDRGVIREGAAADLVLFDPARVRDAATYDRPHAYAEGVPHVIVNGEFVVRDGRQTAARPGVVLTGARR